MTSLIALPDIHQRWSNLTNISQEIRETDVILLTGDMTNGRLDVLRALVETVKKYNERIYAVCGNMDNEPMDIWLNRQKMGIHRQHVLIDEIAIIGCGGALPFYGQYVFSEDELAQFLNESIRDVPDETPKILVCHQPPYGVLDSPSSNPSKHAGSKAVHEFIERVQPLICFTGHMHSSIGIGKIGNTQIINPGPIWQSKKYAYAEVENSEVITLELRNINR